MDPACCPNWCRRPACWEKSLRSSRGDRHPAGLPLIAAAADKACEVIGAGCLAPHIACLSYGTTATINTTHHRYIEVIPLIPPYPAAVPTPTAWRSRSTAATGW
jgi:sugar (pentulose or hexulose) kinase